MKREMTDEIRRKLSGLLPFAPGSSLPFTPEAFQKVEQAFRPAFHLTRFPVAVQKVVDQKLSAGALTREDVVWSLQEGGCIGWETVLGLASGEAIPFTKEAIETLPDPTLYACFWKCCLFTGITTEEMEGLGSSPASTSEQSSKAAENAPVTQA